MIWSNANGAKILAEDDEPAILAPSSFCIAEFSCLSGARDFSNFLLVESSFSIGLGGKGGGSVVLLEVVVGVVVEVVDVVVVVVVVVVGTRLPVMRKMLF